MEKREDRIMKLFKPYIGLPREIYVIFFARIINAMGMFVFPLLTLILVKKIGMSYTEAGFWVALTGIMFMPASLIGGKLADTFGRKKIIIIFDTLAALTYITIAFIEPSMTMVYLIMLASTFFGISDPAHNAIIADITTPENRSGAYSLSYLGFNIGFAIGPFIGGKLFEDYLIWVFLGDAITVLIAIALIFFFIEETLDKSKEEVGEDRVLEKQTEGSIIKVLLSRPILIYFAIISFGYSFVYAQWGFLLPIHAEQSFPNQGAEFYGSLASFNGIIVMVFTPLLTSLFAKTKTLRRIVYGGILYTIGFGMLGFISMKSAFFLSVFIFTTGEILISISFMPFIANHTPASHRGRMNALLPMLTGLGFALGPLGVGKSLNFITVETAWRLLGAVMLIATLLMYLLEKIDSLNEAKEYRQIDEKETVLINE